MEVEVESVLAEHLRRYNKQTAYDHAAKKVLGDRRVLASILKGCAEEFQDYDVETIATKFIQPEIEIETVPMLPDETNAPREKKLSGAATQIESVGTEEKTGTESSTFYDIRFRVVMPGMGPEVSRKIRLIIVLEIQNVFRPKYPLHKRAVFELGRMISSQYGTVFTHSDYGKLQKVYTIFICTAPSKPYRNTITRYHMVEENLVGDADAPKSVYDLTTMVMVCLGKPTEKNYGGLLKMLDVLLSNTMEYTEKKVILQEEFNLPMTEELGEEVSRMCNLGQGIAEENLRKGIEKGRAEGRAEGITNTLLTNLRSLMKSMKWSLDQAMSALEVPEEDRSQYRELLGEG